MNHFNKINVINQTKCPPSIPSAETLNIRFINAIYFDSISHKVRTASHRFVESRTAP